MTSTSELRPATGRLRRVSTWVAIGVALLLVGAIGAVIAAGDQWSKRDALDPESPGPDGTRALAQILSQHGVEVRIARTHGDAAAALAQGGATLVLPNTPALSDEGWTDLAGAAADVVLIDPRTRTLRLAIPGASFSGTWASAPVDPACQVAEAVRSGPVEPSVLFDPGSDGVAACYLEGDAAGLLLVEDDERRTAVVDGTALFANENLAEDGNAALGVNLMGRHSLLVWYQPGVGDTDLPQTDPTLGELTPPWVSPVIVLLLVAGLTAGIWRGRRFGPLVAERLPVTVRASETTEGRARLYAQSRDAVHAADQLRLGALDRLARVLGLGPAASAGDIADAAAARAGVDRGEARRILIDDLPKGDADLVTLHQRLRQFEGAVDAATRPERKPR